MIKRTVTTGLVTAALASSALLLLAGPARADDGSAQCTITEILPHRAVIGITGERVQFGVRTTCDDQDIKFAVSGNLIGTSAHVHWFEACNYTMPSGPSNYDCTHGGSGIINPIGGTSYGYDSIPGNDLAGQDAIYAYAFVDANHNGKDDDEKCTDTCDESDRDRLAGTINLARATQFGDTFAAAPGPVRKGQPITVSATLSTADWNTGTWAGIDATVRIQFKGLHEKRFRTVKTITAPAGQVSTTVTATGSGSWRASYPGSDITAASLSGSDYVKVNRAR